jgi:hypothetical protein
MNWMLEWIARAEGINDADLKTIENAIEPAQQLLGMVKEAMPLLNKALPLVQKVQPAASIILKAVAQKQQPQPLG